MLRYVLSYDHTISPAEMTKRFLQKKRTKVRSESTKEREYSTAHFLYTEMAKHFFTKDKNKAQVWISDFFGPTNFDLKITYSDGCKR